MFVNRSYRNCDACRKLEVVSYVRPAIVNSSPCPYLAPNLALVFGLILCCSIFCYACMFTFFVFISVFQYKTKRLAGKYDSELTYFVSGGT